MAKKDVEPISVYTEIKARKLGTGEIIISEAEGCGCRMDEGCCQDRGCCQEGKSEDFFGCSGDNFSKKIKDRQDLVADYLKENKDSVIKYFKSKGISIEE